LTIVASVSRSGTLALSLTFRPVGQLASCAVEDILNRDWCGYLLHWRRSRAYSNCNI